MKLLQQHFKVLLFIAIYCFGIFVSVKTVPFTSPQNIQQNNKQKEYDTNVSNILHIHIQQSENLLSEITEHESLGFKLSNTNFEIFLFSNELIFKIKFKQYQNYFKNLLIQNRKLNLLFPFHNFW